jgi:hypothetical protein
MEEFLAEIFFELQDLATYGRLLDAIRHMPDRRADSAMLSNIEKEL